MQRAFRLDAHRAIGRARRRGCRQGQQQAAFRIVRQAADSRGGKVAGGRDASLLLKPIAFGLGGRLGRYCLSGARGCGLLVALRLGLGGAAHHDFGLGRRLGRHCFRGSSGGRLL